MLWQFPPSDPGQTLALPKGEVHLWRADLGAWLPFIPQLHGLLAEDEQAKAARFRFDEHRHRSIVARGLLRLLLSRYTRLAAAAIDFAYSPQGKPSMAPSLTQSLEFNLSHSAQMALFAFSATGPIGVDIEYLRPVAHLSQLSQRFFSATEANLIQTCTEDAQISMFFRLWTAKEAYLKATGVGLTNLRQVCLSQSATGELQFKQGWQLWEFTPAPQFQASLAYAGAPMLVKCWQAEASCLV
jgi:4'-phosphopantetheinyl transferase